MAKYLWGKKRCEAISKSLGHLFGVQEFEGGGVVAINISKHNKYWWWVDISGDGGATEHQTMGSVKNHNYRPSSIFGSTKDSHAARIIHPKGDCSFITTSLL